MTKMAAADDAVAMAPELSQSGPIGEIRYGSLQVRLAETAADLDAVQRLRYRVFYEEMGAKPTPEMARFRRDFDDYDALCDHLMVIDDARGPGPDAVVGTYRLIRRSVAEKLGHFYSEAEYDIAKLKALPGEILELGRSCVDAGARNQATLQLLWRGNATYVFNHKIDLMFGCASLPGIDADALAVPLSFLHQHHLAPAELRPRAVPDRYVEMDRLPPGSYDAAAAGDLPPLIKGYLRLGGYVGEGAVIDRQFNTTDVSVVVECATVTEKYYRHYERRAKSAGVTWKPVTVR
jgi:L-ornithine Nalpha-acyltransferase